MSNVTPNKRKAVWISHCQHFNALVKSILTYNCIAWAFTQSKMNQLHVDAFTINNFATPLT